MMGCNGEETFRGLTSVCFLCKSKSAITDPESAETVCSKCGMVMSDNIHETRNLLELKNTKSKGMSTSLASHDGLYTFIGRTDKDARGHKIKPYVHSTMGRLRTWNFRIQTNTSTDRNLMVIFKELRILKPKLGLSDALIEKAAYIYRKAQERGLVRGRSISAVLTAAIYVSCRELGIPKTLKEIASQ